MANERDITKLKTLSADEFNAWRNSRPERLDFAQADLRGLDLSGRNLSNSDFWSANLQGANLTGANLTASNLFHTDLSSADLTNAILERAGLNATTLANAILRETKLCCAKLLPHTESRPAVISECDFGGADMSGAQFSEWVFDRCDLALASMNRSKFQGSKLRSSLLISKQCSDRDSTAGADGIDLQRSEGFSCSQFLTRFCCI
jgi:uncharacterized protein YjbI with pentapeptide repeats